MIECEYIILLILITSKLFLLLLFIISIRARLLHVNT